MQSFPEYGSVSTSGDEPVSEGDPLLGAVLAGRYRIEQLVGAGGMGAVYRAAHVHMRKAVAVKVLHREMAAFPEVVARFEREAVAGGRIDHPNVVSASDFGQLDNGSFYLVLEYVEGQSLAKLVESTGALSAPRALSIARQIAEALRAAHSAGIVHRDLKPENVMLVAKDERPDLVKVLDFGIAKIEVEAAAPQPALTRVGTVFGTPEYMSPEQARGELVDARADLYTVGVILFEMLSGVSPFKDDDLVVVLTRHLTADPPPLPADLDPQIAGLVRQLMRKNPNERVQSAHELIERIDAIVTAPVGSLGLAGDWRLGPAHSARVAMPSMELEAARLVTPAAGLAPTLLEQSVWGALPSASARKLLRRRVAIGPRTVALGSLGFAALGAALGIAAIVVFGARLFGGRSEVSGAGSAGARPADIELAQLVQRVEGGDPSALDKLGARPEQQRSLAVWRALAHRYAALGRFDESLNTYRSGAAAQPGLLEDRRLFRDVRMAAADPEAAEKALKFAAGSLGAPGADLLYEVWETSRGVPSRGALAKQARAYLDEDDERARASPALRLLLELGKSQREGCSSVKRWLERARAEGDARVIPALKRFDDRRGCGFLGLADCYACLRASKDLALTADSVAPRPAPTFD